MNEPLASMMGARRYFSHWIRDAGLYSPEEGVRRLVSGPVRALRLKNRGALHIGMKADVNVLASAAVAERQPELMQDFTGGAPRYIRKSPGCKATIVNGAVTLESSEHTSERVGKHGSWA